MGNSRGSAPEAQAPEAPELQKRMMVVGHCSLDDALRFTKGDIDGLIDSSMPSCKSVDSAENVCRARHGVQSPSCAEFIFFVYSG